MKEKIINIIKEILQKDRRVIFGYLFGSFLSNSNFRDIDIAVYIENSEIKEIFKITSDIKVEIYDELKNKGFKNFIPDYFDVRVMNNASLVFQMEVLTKGKLITDKDYDIRTSFMENVSNRYRDYEQLMKEGSLCL